MKDIFIIILLFVLIYTWSITSTSSDKSTEHTYSELLTQQRVETAFAQWAKKRQIETVWALYNEETRFRDLNNDSLIIGLSAIRRYLFWDRIVSLNPKQKVFELDNIIATTGAAVLNGHFLPFKRGARLEENEVPFFTTLKFDSTGFISEQIWWSR